MSDRSDEVTESRDTDDLLEETEELLSESGVGDGTETGTGSRPQSQNGVADQRPPSGAADPAPVQGSAPPSESDPASTASASWRSKLAAPLSGLAGWLSVDDYFSPKAFLAFVLLVGTGLFAGGLAIPFAGRMVGMFGVAFAIGLLTSKRRYLEMGTAGTSVGALSAVASHAVLAVAGSFQRVVAVGVAVGVVACLGGYYFGRDLRNGLVRDIE